ncbi:hypothetical protein DOTSEDRAFT_22072 [Dothistroma septosporum NZE10]|uniref:Uncharacterized protein n=1 Tax=Dothistroma septosporum (strain NZE10 / CBS 128990) TaxID=675120 RepID=N1PSN8_DOTSN|nr:hypothetical protein DOTSEDRAFT_22072 [Dothistroma septosporum NZE10]
MDSSDYILDVKWLPYDWYERLGQRLVRYSSDVEWAEWPSMFPVTCVGRQGFGTEYMVGTLADRELPDQLDVKKAYHYLGKTATFYTIFGGDWSMEWRLNVKTFPLGLIQWTSRIWDMFRKNCREHEKFDARFAIAPWRLARQDDERFDKWLGLGKVPRPVSESDMKQLIEWHVRHCDLLQARATTPITDQDHEHVRELAYFWRFSQKTKPLLAPMTPTFRAVFMLGRNPMTQPPNVLLVLTGHNQDMKSGPATFELIPRSKIVSWRTDSMVEVSLETTIRYLQTLERREEASNDVFRAQNDHRRRAIYQGMVEDTYRDLEAAHRECEISNGIDTGFDVRRALGNGLCLKFGWEALVQDEKWYHVLSSTSTLREIWHLQDY